MSLKTKILSLFLAAILVIPFLMNPINNGDVKGVVEDRRLSNSSSANAKRGEIAGGVIDYKSGTEEEQNQEVKGIAILNLEAKTPVATNKFPLASEIIVQSGQSKVDLVVSNIDANLPTDVILSLDKQTFELLGGDSTTQSEIDVVVRK